MTKTEAEMRELILKLEKAKAPENWDEMTGPFFHLKLPSQPPKGPYIGAILKQICQEYPLPQDTLLRDAKNIGNWSHLYEHAHFQRRKPEILAHREDISHDDLLYILREGQKYGPYGLDEITGQIERGELLLTDLVCLNKTQEWKKLYEYSNFDRRRHGQKNLPTLPTQEAFDKQESRDFRDANELDALAGIAFLEAQHSKGNSAPMNEEESKGEATSLHSHGEIIDFPKREATKKEKETERKSSSLRQTLPYAITISLMLGVSAFLFTNDPSLNQEITRQTMNLKSSFPHPDKLKEERDGQENTPTRREEIDRDERINSRIVQRSQIRSRMKSKRMRRRKPRSRLPASLSENEDFRRARRQMDDRPYEEGRDPYDDGYGDSYDNDHDEVYDNGDMPVAQDRIRERLNKRTIDPEDDYYSDEEQDFYREEEALENTPENIAEIWGGPLSERRSPANDEGDYRENSPMRDENQNENQDEYYNDSLYQDEGNYD